MRNYTSLLLAALFALGSAARAADQSNHNAQSHGAAHGGAHGGSHGAGHGSAAATAPPRAVLIDGLGDYHFAVTTSNPEAQKFFNQGMVLIYGFNHDEGIRSFRRAAELDPKMAMAHWGIALGLGPNYNIDVDPAREKEAFEHVQKALALSKEGPAHERAFIEALSKRFSGDENPDLKKLANDYAAAMRDLTKRYPDDLDAATLFADAMMCLRPWQLYTKDHQPVEGTPELVAALESVLKRDPDHIGANHLYIHAVEASAHPERALEAAARLPVSAPAAGHLVHMPSHIYARVGDHESSVTSNEAAVAADEKFFADLPDRKNGAYWVMYYPHNIHFIAYAQGQSGNFAEAMKAADKLFAHSGPDVPAMPMLEGFTAVRYGLLVRFNQFDQILRSERPGDEKTFPLTSAMWHFARGVAQAERGDVAAAGSERDRLLAIKAQVPPDTIFGMLNKAHPVLEIAQLTLDAKIAEVQRKHADAHQLLVRAIALEDDLIYSEPPDWLTPSREALGGMLLRQRKFAEAEKVFRDDLSRNPRGGRSLFGLMHSLKAQQKDHEAGLIERQFKAAWKHADTELRVEDL